MASNNSLDNRGAKTPYLGVELRTVTLASHVADNSQDPPYLQDLDEHTFTCRFDLAREKRKLGD
jgi:hypothetical protein